MKTISTLLDKEWHDRYKRIANLNIRSSIYDVTNRCNLRCQRLLLLFFRRTPGSPGRNGS